MFKIFKSFVNWLRNLFWKQEMELTFLGLSNAGKTTLADTLCVGVGKGDNTIPTVGMRMRQFSKGNVEIKLWDVGGQPSFRGLWERYCSGCGAIVYVIDSSESEESIHMSKKELHRLLSKPALQTIPLLVVANKNDLENARDVNQIIKILDLEKLKNRVLSCYSISAKNGTNIDKILQWLIDNGNKRNEQEKIYD